MVAAVQSECFELTQCYFRQNSQFASKKKIRTGVFSFSFSSFSSHFPIPPLLLLNCLLSFLLLLLLIFTSSSPFFPPLLASPVASSTFSAWVQFLTPQTLPSNRCHSNFSSNLTCAPCESLQIFPMTAFGSAVGLAFRPAACWLRIASPAELSKQAIVM